MTALGPSEIHPDSVELLRRPRVSAASSLCKPRNGSWMSRSGGLKDGCRLSDGVAFEKTAKDPAEDKEPFLWLGQLLRSVANGCEEGVDGAECGLHPRCFGVQAGNGHGGLSAMSGSFADGVQQQRAAGDGFGVLFRNRQTSKQRPPVVDQGNDSRHDPAAREIVGGEAGPA